MVKRWSGWSGGAWFSSCSLRPTQTIYPQGNLGAERCHETNSALCPYSIQ